MKEWIFVSALIVAGCGTSNMGDTVDPPTVDPPADAAQQLVFKMVTKEQTFNDCLAGGEGCTYVRLDYPVLVDAPDGYAVTAVTQAVFSSVTANYVDDEEYPTVEALMTAFIDEYRDLKAAMPDYSHPWFLERKVFVVHNTPDNLSMSLSERVFTGGAHGMATLTFQNLDPRTGDEIQLADLMTDGYETQLLPLAEARFRQVRNIQDDMSLADAGFTFENGVFSLTDNFAVGADGLTFYYNPYDVAAYAVGPTEILLTFDELSGVLKE